MPIKIRKIITIVESFLKILRSSKKLDEILIFILSIKNNGI